MVHLGILVPATRYLDGHVGTLQLHCDSSCVSCINQLRCQEFCDNVSRQELQSILILLTLALAKNVDKGKMCAAHSDERNFFRKSSFSIHPYISIQLDNQPETPVKGGPLWQHLAHHPLPLPLQANNECNPCLPVLLRTGDSLQGRYINAQG